MADDSDGEITESTPSVRVQEASIITNKTPKQKSKTKKNNITKEPDLHDNLNDKIIAFLQEKDTFVKTIEIARATIGENAKAKDINPALYKMLSSKLILKKAEENGSKPKWKLV
jgi:hypothetical protein